MAEFILMMADLKPSRYSTRQIALSWKQYYYAAVMWLRTWPLLCYPQKRSWYSCNHKIMLQNVTHWSKEKKPLHQPINAQESPWLFCYYSFWDFWWKRNFKFWRFFRFLNISIVLIYESWDWFFSLLFQRFFRFFFYISNCWEFKCEIPFSLHSYSLVPKSLIP